jgi:hypothetical protein
VDRQLKVKVKQPVRGLEWPSGFRIPDSRFPDCMAKAQDGGKDVSLTYRPPLPTGNAPGTLSR